MAGLNFFLFFPTYTFLKYIFFCVWSRWLISQWGGLDWWRVSVSDQGLQQAEALSNTHVSKKQLKQRTETLHRATVHHRQQVHGVVMQVREKKHTFKYLTSIYILVLCETFLTSSPWVLVLVFFYGTQTQPYVKFWIYMLRLSCTVDFQVLWSWWK